MHILTRSLAVLVAAVIAYAAYAQTAKTDKSQKTDKSAQTAKPAKTPVKDPAAIAPPEDLSKLSKEELEKRLGKDAYNVCIMGGTERPFQNKYWDNHEQGVYLDVISGKPLFASGTKFDSRSGWPSFFEPIDKNEIEEYKDTEFGMVRIEVRAKASGAHLGHVFDDGPAPTGLRYCINSAALKFVPKSEMKAAGLEKYLPLLADHPQKAGGK